jgi:hypothetical protein
MCGNGWTVASNRVSNRSVKAVRRESTRRDDAFRARQLAGIWVTILEAEFDRNTYCGHLNHDRCRSIISTCRIYYSSPAVYPVTSNGPNS